MPWVAWQRDARGSAGRLLAAGASLTVVACSPVPGFGCNDDAQCERGGVLGTCEPIGYCAYPDGECPSGARFSRYAGPPHANECTSPESASTSTGDGFDESSGSGTLDSTDTPEPICGNGIVEEGEECDSGDQPGLDCNRCCRRSGIRLGETLPGRALGSNESYDHLLLDSGDMVLAGMHAVPGQGADALVMRISADGEPRWVRSFHGEPHDEDAEVANLTDHARSVSLGTAGDRVIVSGFLTPDTPPATREIPKVTPRSLIWLAALDLETGETLWEHLDGSPPPSIDQSWDAMYDSMGGIVLAGRHGSHVTVRRYTIAKWNDDEGITGDYEISTDWTQTITGTGGVSTGHAVLAFGDRVLVGGAVRQDTDSLHRLQGFEIIGGEEPRMPCLDAGFATALDNDDRIYDLALAPDGHIAAAGYQFKFAGQGRDTWVGWYTPDGCDLVWQRTSAGRTGENDEARGVTVDDEGNIFVVGFMHNKDSSQDVWVAKYRPMHEMLWEITQDGPASGNDMATSVSIEPDSCEVVVSGHVRSQQGRSDAWVGRFTQ